MVEFYLGFLAGAICTLLYLYYRVCQIDRSLKAKRSEISREIDNVVSTLEKKLNERYRAQPSQLNDQPDKLSSLPPEIAAKMDRVQEASHELMSHMMQLQGPLRNSADAKHRQRTVSVIKALQDEILETMQQVLDLGYDPKTLLITGDGEKRAVPLSEILEIIRDQINETNKEFNAEETVHEASIGLVDDEEDDEPKIH